MIIFKYQWTAILANFVRKQVMSLNSIKEIYYLCNDRQRQEKLAHSYLVHKAHAQVNLHIVVYF